MVTSTIRFSVSSSAYSSSIFCNIRSAKVKDLQQLAEVLTSSFYPPLGWRRWVYPILRFGIYEDLKQRLQTTQQHYRCLAAITPDAANYLDQVVGTVEISCRRYGVLTFHQPQQVYLSNLAVRQDCRRRGVARRLLAASEQQALDWGFRELYLHVMANNKSARQLYQHMGYQVQQAETTVLSLLNAQPQRLLLKKELSPRASSSRLHSMPSQTLPS